MPEDATNASGGPRLVMSRAPGQLEMHPRQLEDVIARGIVRGYLYVLLISAVIGVAVFGVVGFVALLA